MAKSSEKKTTKKKITKAGTKKSVARKSAPKKSVPLSPIEKELKQREAEIAILKGVQEGLASKWELNAIYELVGEKIRDIFAAQITLISTFDHKSETQFFNYYVGRNGREQLAPRPMSGLAKYLIQHKQSILINDHADEKMRKYGAQVIAGNLIPKSALYVPLIAGDETLGLISLQNTEHENFFSDTDVRLLETFAGSLSAALENARLINETRRLLAETEQRNAELEAIRKASIDLSSNLEYTTVLDSILKSTSNLMPSIENINLFIYENNQLIFGTAIANGKITSTPVANPRPGGMTDTVAQTGKMIIVEDMQTHELYKNAPTTWKGALIGLPLKFRKRLVGVMNIHFTDPRTFTDSELRVLQLFADQASVVIENSRLFNETQRLLQETAERNAELGVINSLQQILVSKLDFQSMIDLIGNKVQQVFNAQVTLISLYNPDTQEITHRYINERGERMYFPQPLPLDAFRKKVIETQQPLVINQDYMKVAIELGETPAFAGEAPKSLLFVPMLVADNVTGILSLQDLEHEHAFSDTNVRLLTTIANNLSVALDNARLFDETSRHALESAVINQVGRDISETLNFTSVMEKIAAHARDLLTGSSSAIYLPQPDGKTLRAIVAKGNIQDEILADTITIGEGIIGSLAKEGKAEFINDTNNDKRTI
ncbi:MAG TPA: GAF domain-containing protein, partial [Anaerolineales bacterium]|nr:GAF domain-containing protein [Anaerolineales bacterium]